MTYERWAAGLMPGYQPSLVDLWEHARERQHQLNRPAVVLNAGK